MSVIPQTHRASEGLVHLGPLPGLGPEPVADLPQTPRLLTPPIPQILDPPMININFLELILI